MLCIPSTERVYGSRRDNSSAKFRDRRGYIYIFIRVYGDRKFHVSLLFSSILSRIKHRNFDLSFRQDRITFPSIVPSITTIRELSFE